MRIRKSTIALAAIALLAAGCSGGGNAANTTEPTFTTTEAATDAPSIPTTSTSTTLTTSPSTTLLTVTTPATAPGASTGGPIDTEDWVAVLQGLLDTKFALNAAPDPSQVGSVYVVGTQRYLTFESQLTTLQKDGQRVVDQDPQKVLSAKLVSVPPSEGIEAVNITAKVRRGERLGRIIDANGATVYEIVVDGTVPPDAVDTIAYSLARNPSGPWLILTEG